MGLKLSKIYVFSLYSALIGQVCMLVGLPFQISLVTTLGTYLIVGASFLCLGVWLFEGEHNDVHGKLLFVFVIIFTLLSLTYSWVFSFEIFIKVFSFWELPIFLLTAEKIKSKRGKKVIYAINMFYPILFAVLLASPISHRYFDEYGIVEHENITLGYGNPNETSVYLMVNFIVLLAAVIRFHNIFLKIVCFLEAAFVAYLIFLTDSRAAMIVVISVALMSLFLKRIQLNRLILFCVFAIPIFFFFALKWFPGATIFGEAFDTGRAEMYIRVFEQMNFGKFLLGNFAEFRLENMHNALLSIFASIGVMGAIVFVVILYRQVKKLEKTVALKERRVLLIGVLAVIIHSSVEAAILVSGTAYATLFFTLYYLAIDDSKEKECLLYENTTC